MMWLIQIIAIYQSLLPKLSWTHNIDDIIKGDVIFCATGVTDGDLAKGVKDLGNEYEVTTFALHKSEKTYKTFTNIYNKWIQFLLVEKIGF